MFLRYRGYIINDICTLCNEFIIISRVNSNPLFSPAYPTDAKSIGNILKGFRTSQLSIEIRSISRH